MMTFVGVIFAIACVIAVIYIFGFHPGKPTP
jgi:hypothetical protein